MSFVKPKYRRRVRDSFRGVSKNGNAGKTIDRYERKAVGYIPSFPMVTGIAETAKAAPRTTRATRRASFWIDRKPSAAKGRAASATGFPSLLYSLLFHPLFRSSLFYPFDFYDISTFSCFLAIWVFPDVYILSW